MRRFSGIFLAIPITFVFIFMLNIMLYTTVPFYREALNGALGKEDIPVVEASNEPVIYADEITEIEDATTATAEGVTAVAVTDSTKEDAEKGPEKVIIDKVYYEDCGTGKGYWVITYNDGSRIVE
ncbi:hypothetical protein SAMN04487928_12946 [Butyrivibrio proteoclasticus]|uniref:Uncharacterized protein n=1 Tax=Butyrivibrio proteoclasticus TaxID=43305 RepID=A0A1I5X9X6_9FIRM|nr:hypothetical protein [Butyrivibrio proteoclasticus]SFQ28646.1 hypothetical protein SAMN04487928_12946 [Butyrivibrio proteoclasticus]